MRLNTSTDDIKNTARANASPGYTEQSGFWDNMKEAAGLIVREDWSLMQLMPPDVEVERNSQIDELIVDGTITEDVSRYFDKDYDGLAEYANRNLDQDLMTKERIESEGRKDVLVQRRKAAETFERSSPLGTAGKFIGLIGTSAADPIYFPTYFTGVGAGLRGAKLAAGMAKVASVEVTMESLKTWATWDRKAELGVELSGSQVMTNLAAAAIGANVFTGVGYGVRAFREMKAVKAAKVVDDIADTVSQVADENIVTGASDAKKLGQTLRNAANSELTKDVKAEEVVDQLMASEKVVQKNPSRPIDPLSEVEDVVGLKRTDYEQKMKTDPEFNKMFKAEQEALIEKHAQIERAKGCI
jgi:hypothetical protein